MKKKMEHQKILFLQTNLRNNNLYKFPTWKDCMNFSIESIGNIDTVLGVHGTDKYYIDPNIKFNFIETFLSK